jgi:hypothetical protein
MTDEPPLAKCFDSFVTYLKFAIAFINSCMISMTLFLNRKSKDYRYVIQALEKEKKHLKVNVESTIGSLTLNCSVTLTSISLTGNEKFASRHENTTGHEMATHTREFSFAPIQEVSQYLLSTLHAVAECTYAFYCIAR